MFEEAPTLKYVSWNSGSWKAITLRSHEQAFTLDIPKGTLENAEGFNNDNWPVTSREWLSTTYDYYGYQSYWQREVT